MKSSTGHTVKGGGRRARPGRETGATLVEFVIVSPVAILLVLAIIQLGLMMSAKQILNEATFVAARAGAVQNAQVDPMKQTLYKALIPFYQNTLDGNATTRIANAWVLAQQDLAQPPPVGNLDIRVLNPSPEAFSDFGLTDANNHTYIPNDSLGYRDYTGNHGKTSGLSIQDANVLKIQVTYAYELKVPLMQSVFKSVMCGFDSGVNAFGRGGTGSASSQDCTNYYNRGRVPIVSYAMVQMQTPAWQ